MSSSALILSARLSAATSVTSLTAPLVLRLRGALLHRRLSTSSRSSAPDDGDASSDPRSATSLHAGRIRRRDPGDRDPTSAPSLVLHVSAGHGDSSLVTSAARTLFDAFTFDHELKERLLWKDQLVSLNFSHVAAKMRLLKGKGSPEDEELFLPIHRMAEELNMASVLVISTPMWNFSFPYVLKQYIDIALQPGVNFLESPERPVTTNKHLVVISSSGGSYGENNPRDHLGPYLRDLFNMLGFTCAHEVKIQGASQVSRAQLLARAAQAATDAANEISTEIEARRRNNRDR